MKVDDDATCQDVEKLVRLVDEVIMGAVNPRTGTASCAFWHFGKCTDENINQRPDGLLWLAPYAGGQGYWLNAKVTGAMAKMCLLHERYLEVEHFEDRASRQTEVSPPLRDCGARDPPNCTMKVCEELTTGASV